jgi:non-canonical purine NTP pyrophosphatase (RdgB/HAM1 family)
MFTFVTESADKVGEAERILGVELEKISLNLPEIQAMDVERVVENKVVLAFEALGGKPAMVEDTGLYIEAWNGLPGALIKWFVGSVGAVGMCRMMRDYRNRNAVAKTLVATYDGQLSIFAGTVKGTIPVAPSGTRGFGWDPIFVPEGATKTFAEMSGPEKDTYSMRRSALEAMAACRSKRSE